MRTGDSPDALGAAAAAGAMLPLAASFAAPAPSIWELVGLAWRTGAVGALGELRRVEVETSSMPNEKGDDDDKDLQSGAYPNPNTHSNPN